MSDNYTPNGGDSPANFNEEEVRQFWEMLSHPDLAEYYQGVFSSKDKREVDTQYCKLSDTDGLVELCRKLVAAGRDVYAEMGLVSEVPRSGRTKVSIVEAVRGYWGEADVKADGHDSGDDGAESREQVMEFISDLPVTPTMLLHSGGGLHWHIMLKVPEIMHSDDDKRDAFKRSHKAFESASKNVAKQHGFEMCSVGDLARPMRVPGTYNTKRSKMGTIIDYDPDRRYTHRDLAQWTQANMTPEQFDVANLPEETQLEQPSDETLREAAKIIAENMPPEGKRHNFLVPLCGFLRGYSGKRLSTDNTFKVIDRAWNRVGKGPEEVDRAQLWNPIKTTNRRIENMEPVAGGRALERHVEGLATKLAKVLNFHTTSVLELIKPCEVNLDYPLTEVGNGQRLAELIRGRVLYVRAWDAKSGGGFLAFDGKRFKVDAFGMVEREAKRVARTILQYATYLVDEARRFHKAGYTEVSEKLIEKSEVLQKFAMRSESKSSIRSMMELAKSEPGIETVVDELDADPYLLNCQNGTLDLRTFELKDHDPADKLTKITGCEWDPDADRPIFEQFLAQVLEEEAVRGYVQRVFGYSISGDVAEHILVVLYGTGSNGKSTLVRAIMDTLGDYAIQAAPELLVAKKGSHPTELTDLYRTRFVASTEIEGGQRLNEALIKQITGGDKIRARRMNQDFWEFEPTHTVVMSVNHRPIVRGTDHGMWRRLNLVPFTVTIEEEEQDKELPAKLRSEMAGILAWLVEGHRDVLMGHSLATPETIRDATDEYRADMDDYGTFLAAVFDDDPGGYEKFEDIYIAYKIWVSRNGARLNSDKALAQELGERGFENKRSTGGERRRLGLQMKGDWFELVEGAKENDELYRRA